MELVRIVSADFFKDEKRDIWVGALASVALPNKWILEIHPDHPAYPELLAQELKGWPVKDLHIFLNPALPHITQQYAKAEIERRKK